MNSLPRAIPPEHKGMSSILSSVSCSPPHTTVLKASSLRRWRVIHSVSRGEPDSEQEASVSQPSTIPLCPAKGKWGKQHPCGSRMQNVMLVGDLMVRGGNRTKTITPDIGGVAESYQATSAELASPRSPVSGVGPPAGEATRSVKTRAVRSVLPWS